MAQELTVGFLPLVDACLPILAREHGFAEEEGLDLTLMKDMSWATVLDRLLYGAVADFFHFHWQDWSFYIFNLADVAITAGVLLLILDVVGIGRKTSS